MDITIIGIVKIILYVIITILLIYIIYNIFVKHTNTNTNTNNGILGFILRYLLFITQPIIYFFKWIYKTLTISNILSFFILSILGVIIMLYIFYQYIMNYITNIGINNNNITDNTQLILQGPVSINTENVYSIKKPPTLSNYTFSFWFYINNSPINNYEIPIFKYASGSPYITINNNFSNNMNLYPSQYYITNNQPIPFSIKTQKWNYIVIQYTANSIEFYLNSLLIYSLKFKDTTIPTYMHGDNIIIGNTNIASNGIGAISNLNYYTTPLTSTQINIQYQILLLQNIPIGF